MFGIEYKTTKYGHYPFKKIIQHFNYHNTHLLFLIFHQAGKKRSSYPSLSKKTWILQSSLCFLWSVLITFIQAMCSPFQLRNIYTEKLLLQERADGEPADKGGAPLGKGARMPTTEIPSVSTRAER